MTKQELLEKLCKLCGEVRDRKFGLDTTADCFCGRGDFPFGTMDSKVFEFIQEAVQEKLWNEGID
ncbi:MAG: hypothetical protein ACXADY_26325 [Candidatus Hodarchaeales archaeon]